MTMAVIGVIVGALCLWGAWCGWRLARQAEERRRIDAELAEFYARAWREMPEYAARIAMAAPVETLPGERAGKQ